MEKKGGRGRERKGKRQREGEIEVRKEEEGNWRSQSPTKSQKRKSSKSSQSGQGLEVSWMVHQPLRFERVGLILPLQRLIDYLVYRSFMIDFMMR